MAGRGTLTGSADLTVSGQILWSNGTMTGSGTTTANGGMEIRNTLNTLGRRLRNAGTTTETGNGALAFGPGGFFDNLPGAVAGHAPHPEGTVAAGRHGTTAVGRQAHREDRAAVPLPGAQALPRFDIP